MKILCDCFIVTVGMIGLAVVMFTVGILILKATCSAEQPKPPEPKPTPEEKAMSEAMLVEETPPPPKAVRVRLVRQVIRTPNGLVVRIIRIVEEI